MAQATFKLLRNNGYAEHAVVKFLAKQKFTNKKQSHGIDGFVKWSELVEHFVNKENKAFFQIHISVEPLFRLIETDMVMINIDFRSIVENIDKLESFQSSEKILQGVKWKFHVQKKGDNLALFLKADENDMQKNWFYPVKATFELQSFDETVAPITKSFKMDFKCLCFIHLGIRRISQMGRLHRY